ncbi:MAG: hypothetical protein AAGJ18_29770 [Bacteroidota bacterium]
MGPQFQLFLKLFIVYLIVFGAMTFLFDYAMGNQFDLGKSALLFLLVAGYLSWRRSRKMMENK